ncbi:hypothetical protein F2Q68_00042253 [Brassica cretica]|uniref:Reverse transcriptase zinc-binding domain-containing protein n=1 Tax=Brassica cretica TaxID=69181 RepID=A0A8S9MF54_BRACR|nr:hypothetical protein F2Q68_00042253 [Brassica cretica]
MGEMGKAIGLLISGTLVYHHCANRNATLLSLFSDVLIVLLSSLAILDSWISTSAHTLAYEPPKEVDRDLVVSDLLQRGSGMWNKQRVEAVLPTLADQIYLIHPSTMGADDAYCWYRSTSGIYSVKSGYYVMVETEVLPSHPVSAIHSFNWNKYVWSINTSQKLKLFLWKTGRGDLPLGENFQARGLFSFETCPHCGETESETHLFLECPYAQQVWTRAPISTLPDFTSTSTPLQALMMASSLVGLPPMGIISDIFSWICWNILTARNNLLFENRPISASTTMMNAISGAREWLVAQESSKPLCHILPLCRPPTHLPQEFTPCNSDRAWTGDSLTAGLGWIIHCDRVGQQIQGSSSCDFISSPLLVEAIALKMTLLAAHSYFISKVWIRSDSKGLIRAINSKTYSMELFGVLTNIEFLSASFDFVFFSSRENRTQQLTY